jgi:hypothetical protein
VFPWFFGERQSQPLSAFSLVINSLPEKTSLKELKFRPIILVAIHTEKGLDNIF